MIVIYFVVLLLLSIFSFGFIDLNFPLPTFGLFHIFHQPLRELVFHYRPIASLIFVFVLSMLFVLYSKMILSSINKKITLSDLKRLFFIIVITIFFSFPALTYDLFNYIMTAKVTYQYHENPYVVMPIEIPNDPNLIFTRAANKVALYGPTWILLSAIPHALGSGNIWLSIYAFKFMNVLAYLFMIYLIYKLTKNITNVIFFALNPLIIIEILISGHNDIYMMLLAIAGLWLVLKGNGLFGWVLFITSVFVKGATLILTPLFFFLHRLSREKIWLIAYWSMFGVFIFITPLREELYPWYAVWFLSFAALLPWIKQYHFIRGLSIALSIGLELRHVPYMYMGYYENPGPLLRTMVTVIPVAIFLIWYRIVNTKTKHV